MNTEEKIEAAGKKKEEGNALFKAGKYTRASKRYEKVNCVINLLAYYQRHFLPLWYLFVMTLLSVISCRLWSTLSMILPLAKRRKNRQRHWKLHATLIMQLASWSWKITKRLKNCALRYVFCDKCGSPFSCYTSVSSIIRYDVGIQVLEAESKNVKALYRRAQAYIQLADLDLAEFDIKKALEIDPNNRYMSLSIYLFIYY